MFKSLVWLDPEKIPAQAGFELSALEADALTTRPTRRSCGIGHEELNQFSHLVSVWSHSNSSLCYHFSELLEGDKEYRAIRRKWAEAKRKRIEQQEPEAQLSVRDMLDEKEVVLPENAGPTMAEASTETM